MAPGTVRIAAVIASAAAAVAGLAGCASRSSTAVHPSDHIVSASAAPSQLAGVATIAPPSSPPTFSKALAERGLLVIGASYTQGLGAQPSTDGYAYQLGRKLGWHTEVDGVAGTGFVNPGPRHQGTFAQRIARLHPDFVPGVVLIQGGRNDAGAAANVLFNAVRRTVSVTRAHFHGADIALLGPIPGALPVGRRTQTVDNVLARAAKAESVLFIDPLAEHWISPANVRRFQGPVRGHPNNAGYAYIADRLSADLRSWSEGRTA